MKEEEIKIVKGIIKTIVEDHIDSQINYEWEGSDFTERLMNELPNFEGGYTFDRIVQNSSSDVQFDNVLYQKFLDHITDFIFESLKFETEKD